jgi:hypothetical protein
MRALDGLEQRIPASHVRNASPSPSPRPGPREPRRSDPGRVGDGQRGLD